MARRRKYERPNPEDYEMPAEWRRLDKRSGGRGKQDKAFKIKDEWFRSTYYLTTAEWRVNENGGIFNLQLVIPLNGRTEREAQKDSMAIAHQLFQFKKGVCVAEKHWGQDNATLFVGFPLDAIPTIPEVEALYCGLKGLVCSSYTPLSIAGNNAIVAVGGGGQ